LNRISIIIPVYNAEKTLDRCVRSILAQTHTNFELLLVDDGSTDNSAAIADAFASKDVRVSVIHTPNRGVSVARNTGLGLATGDFIGFADSDDWAEPEMYAHLLMMLQQAGADIAVCGYLEEHEAGTQVTAAASADDTLSADQAYRLALTTDAFGGFCWNKLFKNVFFSPEGHRIRFDESLHVCEDLLVVCECLSRAQKVAYDSRPLYHYAIFEGNARGRPFSARKATLLFARKKLIDLTQLRFPQLAATAENLYVTDVVHTFLQAVYAGADTSCIKGDLKRIRKYALPYFFRKGNRFSYRMMAVLLSVSPRLARALRRRKKQ